MLTGSFARIFVAACCGMVLPLALSAAGYQENKALVSQLKQLARSHKKIFQAEKVCDTPGKNEVWRAELGAGDDDERSRRPAMLVVAGIEGNDLFGTASVMAWADALTKGYDTDEKIRKLLDSTTIYVWPRLNPDGTGHYFSKPRLETSTNDRPVDDDHDGLLDEDGPEDLNGDGWITMMRIEDPDGEYILDPAEPRLLLKADKLKGERGAWKYLTEGKDNDGDKNWNEDPQGGVNFNRNFPFGFKFFAPGSGRHQVSETETRALADFVIAHPNIGIVFTFGAADNLVQTPKAEAPKRPPAALHEEDAGWYREIGKTWRDELGLKKELTVAAEPGTFSDWMYFHRGRLSLAARPWSPALQLELAKARAKEDGAKPPGEKPGDEAAKKDDKPKSDDKAPAKPRGDEVRNEEERAFIKWADENARESFVPWKAFEHPDFPGRKVEIGGFVPFAKTNPPEKSAAELTGRHGKFLSDLAGRLPRVGIRKAEAKHLGAAVYEVTAQVENSGYLPTSLAQGTLSREVHPTRVMLKVDEKFILSGPRTAMLGAIPGGDAKEVRWVVRAKGLKGIEVEVISMVAGRAARSIELKEENK